MVVSYKESHITDKHSGVDVSAMPNVSLYDAANIDGPSPLLAPSLSSSQSGNADVDIPVASSRYTHVTGSTSLLTGAVGASDLASGATRFVRAVTNWHFLYQTLHLLFAGAYVM